jgi:hypothetical protein
MNGERRVPRTIEPKTPSANGPAGSRSSSAQATTWPAEGTNRAVIGRRPSRCRGSVAGGSHAAHRTLREHAITRRRRRRLGWRPRPLLGRFPDALGVDTSSWSGDDAARNVSLDMVQVELTRRLNQTTAASLDHRAQRRLVHDELLPCLRPPRPARRIRLPSSEREWIEAETCPPGRRPTRLRRSPAWAVGRPRESARRVAGRSC